MRGRVRSLGAALLLVLIVLPAARSHAEEDLKLPIPRALGEALMSEASWSRWLPSRQLPDGRWSAMDWDRWCRLTPHSPRPRLVGRATEAHDVSATALVMATFLASGLTHRGSHPYSRVVRRGLRWLKRRQSSGGSFVRSGDPDPVAAHAIATLAITEAFGMTDSPIYRMSCRRAVAHLLALRGANGVWQRPGSEEDDALATFWACMALKSAQFVNKDAVRRGRKAQIAVDTEAAIARILAWFDERTDAQAGLVEAGARERARGGTTPVLTAAGALIRFFAGETAKTSKTLAAAIDHLASNAPERGEQRAENDSLYVYIGTLATFQAGGKWWDHWKRGLEEGVVDAQRRNEDHCGYRGSWNPQGPWAAARGRVVATALESLALSVFYRYDRVFGDRDIATRQAPRIELVRPGRTWKRTTLPSHAARMNLAGGGTLPLDAAHVRADVQGVRAQVVLDLFLTNTDTRMHEGVLDLRLPDGAAPYYLAFGTAQLAAVPAPGAGGTVGTDLASLHAAREGAWGKVLEARMAPVAPATKAFETIVATARDPALLTWSGAGMFHLRVFPLEPGKQHRIVVGYEVDLTPVGEDAELLLALPEGLDNVRVAVRAPGSTWGAEPSAPLDEDGVRTWHEPGSDAIRVRIEKPGDRWLLGTSADGRRHTAAWVRPSVPRVPRATSTRAHFLIDISKSVAANHMRIWQELVPAILEASRDRLATFRVGFFDMRTTWWRGGDVRNTPENVAALRKQLLSLEPGGATDLVQALRSVRDGPEAADVFLFTDGMPTWGRTDVDAVLEQAHESRPVFTYATGLEGEDRALLSVVSTRSGGDLFSVLGHADIPAAARAHRFRAWGVDAVSVTGLQDVLIAGDPQRIYPGQRLRVVGRGWPTVGFGLYMELRHRADRRTVTAPFEGGSVSPMATRAYGQAGVERLEAAGPALRPLAQDYAMHFRVVREACALVMLETEADYKRYGLDETGHAERVARSPVLAALARRPVLAPAVPKPTTLAEFAEAHDVPAVFALLLREADAEALSTPALERDMPRDAVLRELGSALEDDGSGGRYPLALHALGLGLHGHVCSLLRPSNAPDSPVVAWLLARAAARAHKPLWALFAYEDALNNPRGGRHGEVYWVIAADYERYLRRFLARRTKTASARFARARLASLERWRERLGVFAPPRCAALVVLHQPFDWRDRVTIEVRGPQGVAADTTDWDRRPSNVRVLPEDPGGAGPQMTAVRKLGRGPWSARLVRPPDDGPDRPRGRSLVIVIRNWGTRCERIEFVRSVGPDDDPIVYRTTGRACP